MFFTLNNFTGTVIYENANFILCKISGMNNGDLSNTDTLLDLLKKVPANRCRYYSQFNCARYPDYLFIDKKGLATTIPESDLAQFPTSQEGVEVKKIISKNTIKGKDFSCTNIFQTAKLSNNQLEFADSFFTHKLDFTNSNGIITCQHDFNEDADIRSYIFANEYEAILVNKADIQTMLPKLQERMKVERISGHYVVHGDISQHRKNCLSIRPIPYMKVDEMLRFFENNKKCQTKVETLAECFRSIAKGKKIEIGKKFVICMDFQTRSNETSYNCIPADQVYVMASSFKILSSEQVDTRINMIVECREKSHDDFAQTLWTSMDAMKTQSGQKNGPKILCIPMEKLDEIISLTTF